MATETVKNKAQDYSGTLNLPKPDKKNENGLDTNDAGIPMRANLPQRELGILEKWQYEDVYRKSLKAHDIAWFFHPA